MPFSSQWFNKTEAYTIDQSCRFDSDTPAYLARTFGTPTSDKIWTLSFWAKICRRDSGNLSIFMGAGDWNTDYTAFYVTPDLKWDDRDHSGAAWKTQFRTNAVYRDPSAWYHIVWSYDSTPSTPSASSIKMFVNGEQLTSFSSETYPSQNTASVLNTAVANWIGGVPTNGATYYFDGYMAEVVFVDGTALNADSFGETNSTTGQWIPKAISGLTFGNNGFHLDFADSSSLGNDVSGNNNDFTSSGLAAADQVSDSPTDNFCTWNPIYKSGDGAATGGTMANGNLHYTAVGDDGVASTFPIDVADSDGWYCEITEGRTSVVYTHYGLMQANRSDRTPRSGADVYAYYGHSGDKKEFGSDSSYGDTITAGDVVSIAIKNGAVWYAKNGTWQNSATEAEIEAGTTTNAAHTGLTDEWYIVTGKNAGTAPHFIATLNCGQHTFAHTVPDGLKKISTANLPDPTIDDPSAYFQPTLYTGDGASSLAVNQDGNKTFSPDFVWIKNRDAVADKHVSFDTVRGATESLSFNNTDVEETNADTLTAFDSDGFTVGADVLVNTNTEKYVGWQWLADESWSSTATGTRIASSGARNTTAGFSIAIWTHQTSGNYNIAHGLTVRPDFFVVKAREQGVNWGTWHQNLADVAKRLIFNTTSAETTGYWADPTDNTDIASGEYPVTSTLYGYQHDSYDDTHPSIGYFFTEVENYSKFGSYTSNNSADGPFIWCGFKPSLLIIKNTAGATNWEIRDSARSPFNVAQERLLANSDGEEDNSSTVDFLSNGFKLVAANAAVNPSAALMVFAAFAESPFQYATAR